MRNKEFQRSETVLIGDCTQKAAKVRNSGVNSPNRPGAHQNLEIEMKNAARKLVVVSVLPALLCVYGRMRAAAKEKGSGHPAGF